MPCRLTERAAGIVMRCCKSANALTHVQWPLCAKDCSCARFSDSTICEVEIARAWKHCRPLGKQTQCATQGAFYSVYIVLATPLPCALGISR